MGADRWYIVFRDDDYPNKIGIVEGGWTSKSDANDFIRAEVGAPKNQYTLVKSASEPQEGAPFPSKKSNPVKPRSRTLVNSGVRMSKSSPHGFYPTRAALLEARADIWRKADAAKAAMLDGTASYSLSSDSNGYDYLKVNGYGYVARYRAGKFEPMNMGYEVPRATLAEAFERLKGVKVNPKGGKKRPAKKRNPGAKQSAQARAKLHYLANVRGFIARYPKQEINRADYAAFAKAAKLGELRHAEGNYAEGSRVLFAPHPRGRGEVRIWVLGTDPSDTLAAPRSFVRAVTGAASTRPAKKRNPKQRKLKYQGARFILIPGSSASHPWAVFDQMWGETQVYRSKEAAEGFIQANSSKSNPKEAPAVGTWVTIPAKHADRVLPGFAGKVGTVEEIVKRASGRYAKVKWEHDGSTREAPLDVLQAANRRPAKKRNPADWPSPAAKAVRSCLKRARIHASSFMPTDDGADFTVHTSPLAAPSTLERLGEKITAALLKCGFQSVALAKWQKDGPFLKVVARKVKSNPRKNPWEHQTDPSAMAEIYLKRVEDRNEDWDGGSFTAGNQETNLKIAEEAIAGMREFKRAVPAALLARFKKAQQDWKKLKALRAKFSAIPYSKRPGSFQWYLEDRVAAANRRKAKSNPAYKASFATDANKPSVRKALKAAGYVDIRVRGGSKRAPSPYNKFVKAQMPLMKAKGFTTAASMKEIGRLWRKK